MRATPINLLQFLRTADQFSTPPYQRPYSWTHKECTRLWDDILRTGSDKTIGSHFLGSIAHLEGPGPQLLSDGQQRLTTITILMEVLARFLGQSEPVDGFSAKKLRYYYLTNPLKKGGRRYKLLLKEPDRATLFALLARKEPPGVYSLPIESAFRLFFDLIAQLDCDYTALCRGLEKLMIIDVTLTRGHDDPQRIFETMNSTGRKIQAA